MPINTKPSNYTIDCPDVVHVVEFSPFEWSSQLIAIGTSTRVTVGTCRFQDELGGVEGMEYSTVRDFYHGPRVTALALAPDTSLLTMPKVLHFTTGGADRKLRIFHSDLKSQHSVKELEGHSDYINDVAYDMERGENIVSVSDDQTCRVWSSEGTEKACLPLGAPGMCVRWHTEDPQKMMVAEKGGIIRFYNVLTQQPIMSLDCGVPPLLSADWCPANSIQVAALSGQEWVLFDTSRSSRPIERHQAHTAASATHLRACRSHDHLVASVGTAGAEVRVSSIKTGQVLLATDLPIATHVCWHYRLPLVAVGGDRKVHIWSVDALG